MKVFKLLPLALLFLVASCSSVRVSSDYDTATDFSKFKTFAFYKKGIDKVEISDLDKRRILKALESELLAKSAASRDAKIVEPRSQWIFDSLAEYSTSSLDQKVNYLDISFFGNSFHKFKNFKFNIGWSPPSFLVCSFII